MVFGVGSPANDIMGSMRVALCQIPVSSRPEVNAGRVRDALGSAAAQGADLAVFPEATQARFGSDLLAAAEPLDGPFCSGLAAAAKQTGVALVAGAELLVLPAAWAAGLFKEEHWVTLVRARAIENTMWVAAVCQVPDPGEPPTKAATGVGRSMLVDPLGVVRADLGPAAGVTVAEVDTSLIATVRATLPSLANRRDDVFGPPAPVTQ